MRIRIGELKRILREASAPRHSLLLEDDSESHEEGASGESLDSQVDRYLGQYETDAKKGDNEVASVDQMEALDWRDLVKGRLLTEAGDGDRHDPWSPGALHEAGESDKDDDDKGDAAPGAEGMTGDDSNKPGVGSLDVEKFANDVVRLIDNYDSLLEVKNTLIRRATAFLKKNYDDEVVKSFEDTLRDDHSMEAGEDKGELDADKYPAPSAERASGSAEAGPGGAPGGA